MDVEEEKNISLNVFFFKYLFHPVAAPAISSTTQLPRRSSPGTMTSAVDSGTFDSGGAKQPLALDYFLLI